MADGKLAGSVLTMDKAVRNLTRFAGWSVSQAVTARQPESAAGRGVREQGRPRKPGLTPTSLS